MGKGVDQWEGRSAIERAPVVEPRGDADTSLVLAHKAEVAFSHRLLPSLPVVVGLYSRADVDWGVAESVPSEIRTIFVVFCPINRKGTKNLQMRANIQQLLSVTFSKLSPSHA